MKRSLYILGLASVLVGASFLLPRPAAAAVVVDCTQDPTTSSFEISEPTNSTAPETNNCLLEDFVPLGLSPATKELHLNMTEASTLPGGPNSDVLTLTDSSGACVHIFVVHCTLVTISSDLNAPSEGNGETGLPTPANVSDSDQTGPESTTANTFPAGSTLFEVPGICFDGGTTTGCTRSLVGLSDAEVVPEPSTGLLMLSSVLPAALGIWRSRRSAK